MSDEFRVKDFSTGLREQPRSSPKSAPKPQPYSAGDITRDNEAQSMTACLLMKSINAHTHVHKHTHTHTHVHAGESMEQIAAEHFGKPYEVGLKEG